MQSQSQIIKQVAGLKNIKDVIAGSSHSIAIADDGIWTWGKTDSCCLGIDLSEPIIDKPLFLQISATKACAGSEHTFAWKNNEVYCWGSNRDYKLGLEQPKQYQLTKSKIFVEAIDAGMQLSNISCGDSHSLAVFKLEEQQEVSYQIFAWGESKSYQLGLQVQGAVNEPILVQFNQSVQDIFSRSQYNFILTEAGNCYSWGTNLFGRLGFSNQIKNQKLPSKVKTLTSIKSISMGRYHCIAISESMECYSWGHGLHGQLGLNQIFSQKTPTKILLEDKIIQSACGEYHSIVMTEKGEIMSCGTNSYSALGHHRVDNKKRCKKFEKIQTGGIKIVKVVSGNRHNLLLTVEGSVYSWGCNKFGQLGIGSSIQQIKREGLVEGMRLNENKVLKEDLNGVVQIERKGCGCLEQKSRWGSKDMIMRERLGEWRIRYERFKKEREEEEKQLMKELNQILDINFTK